MKAWVLHEIGNLSFDEVCKPQPKEGEVLVEVKAAGICGSDIPRIYRDGAHRMPLICGHEFSGRVAETGAQTDPKLLGKRVGVFPLIPCRRCIACRKGQYEMCRDYSYLGSRRDGGFAEYAAVPADNLIELPQNVTYEQAAMMEPMAVAVHAMRRVAIMPQDVVVVCGLGTIGQFLAMFLLERGISNLLVIGNKDLQREKILAMGLPEEQFCDSRKEDIKSWIGFHTDHAGADVFFECIGKNETVSLALEQAAPGGSVCFVGNPYTDMTLDKSVYWKILRNQLRITGTWNSAFFPENVQKQNERIEAEITDWDYVLNRLAKGRIRPEQIISHRFEPAHLEEGFRLMRDKSQEYLKVMQTYV